MKQKVAVVFIFLLTFGNTRAQIRQEDMAVAQRFILRRHPYDSDFMEYRLFIPERRDIQPGNPLVLTFHGYSNSADSWKPITSHPLAVIWARDSVEKKHACFVVSPCIKFSQTWVETPWSEGSYSLEDTPITKAMACVCDLLDSIVREFRIDTTRIYVTGFSMGGFATWDIAMRFPHRFAAIVPICGGGDPSHACDIAHLPIWTMHGRKDGTIPVSSTREMVNALVESGRKVVYTNCRPDSACTAISNDSIAKLIKTNVSFIYSEYEFEGHVGAWRGDAKGYDNPQLINWMLGWKKGVELKARNTARSEGDAINRPGRNPGTRLLIRCCFGSCPLSEKVFDLRGRAFSNVRAPIIIQTGKSAPHFFTN